MSRFEGRQAQRRTLKDFLKVAGRSPRVAAVVHTLVDRTGETTAVLPSEGSALGRLHFVSDETGSGLSIAFG